MSAIVDQLTKYERDLCREDQKHPSVTNPDLKPYLSELWDWEAYQRSTGREDNIESAIAGWACNYPGWTREEIVTVLAFKNINGALNADLGWARRLYFDDPADQSRRRLGGLTYLGGVVLRSRD